MDSPASGARGRRPSMVFSVGGIQAEARLYFLPCRLLFLGTTSALLSVNGDDDTPRLWSGPAPLARAKYLA